MTSRETMTISEPPERRVSLQGCVATGHDSRVSEVVRAALRTCERVVMGGTPIDQQAMARQIPAPRDRA